MITKASLGAWFGAGQSLIWEENGITISLIGEGLTPAEFMKVAEGLP